MHSEAKTTNFIDSIIANEESRDRTSRIVTRFPPEPNGYLHIGSAYAINISHSIARKYGGEFHLRMDDTNPLKENEHFVRAILEDVEWLGVDYGGKPFYGSDYFQQIYDYARFLIAKGRAYVCDLSLDEIRDYRGTLTQPGKNSPYRERSIEENLELFERMEAGEFAEGERVLRAKIDMTNPNICLRDPVLFRIIKKEHYRTGADWVIYPMYDFAHPIQDYLEGISHSLCSSEFINNRPLYEWVLKNLELKPPLPRQIEFGRLNITGVVTSKRHLRRLVESGQVEGWDDPRLPTLRGLRRRGYTRQAILAFLDEIGVPRQDSTVDVAMLEHAIRTDLNTKAIGLMAVLDPLKVIITNKHDLEYVDAENNPKNDSLGTRKVPFGREIFIERSDFAENPPKGFRHLIPGNEVRLKNAYFIRCNDVIKDEAGNVKELHCTYDPQTKSGSGFTGRKVKGTIQWVSATEARRCQIRLFEPLFEKPPGEDNLFEALNPHSLMTVEGRIEPAVEQFLAAGETHFQFLRTGFFVEDSRFSSAERRVFNRIVPLKSSYKL